RATSQIFEYNTSSSLDALEMKTKAPTHFQLEEPMKSYSLLRSRIVFAASTLLVVLLFSASAFAQQGTSSVRGVVSDPQGNVVAGATVTLINPGTSASRATTTNDIGTYS